MLNLGQEVSSYCSGLGTWRPQLIDLLSASDAVPLVKAIYRYSKKFRLYPNTLQLYGVQKIGDQPVAGGAFGDIWEGYHEQKKVAIKVMRPASPGSHEKLYKVGYHFLLATRKK